MKPLFILSILLTIVFEGFCQENEESKSDSTVAEQTYSVVPFLEKQTIKESSSVVYQVADPSVLQFSYGQSILSSLTGQVPNMTVKENGYSGRLGSALGTLGSFDPDWTTHWTNHFILNTLTLRTIMGWSYGGNNIAGFYPPQVYDRSNFNIAELAIGYSFRNILKGRIMNDVNLSRVGRNLFIDYYKTDIEVPENFLDIQKNVSFNLGIAF